MVMNDGAVFRDLNELCTDVGQFCPDVDSRTIRTDVPALLENLLACGLVIPKTVACGD